MEDIFFKKEVEKKVARKNSNFVPNSQNQQAVWGFCLQDRYILGERTENSLLCVLSLKHRLLNSLEFEKRTFLLQEILLYDDSHNTKLALHSYTFMKQKAKEKKWKRNKWRRKM